MSDRSSPLSDGLPPRSDQWDIVVKVKCGNTLKRFNGFVNGSYFTLNLSLLRSKIASAFKFSPDTDFILTYTDEDGDVVMLDDDEDLHDAAIHQKLNPLRIDVQIKNIPSGASQTNQHESTPLRTMAQEDPLAQIKSVIDEALKPLRSPAREDPLAHLKSAIDDAMKSIREPVPESLSKLSRDVLDAAPPQLTELIKPFVNLITSSHNTSGGLSGSSGVEQQTQTGLKDNDAAKVEACFGPRSSNARNSESSETAGLKSVLVEAPVVPSAEASQGQHASLYPSVDGLLFTSSGGDKSASNRMSDAQTKGKSVMPSAAPLPPPVVPTSCSSHPVSSTNGWSHSHAQRWVDEWTQPLSIWQPEANVKVDSDSRWRIPMYRAPHASLPVPHAPPLPRFPFPGRLLSSGRLYGDLGNSNENSSTHTSHRWIQCDGCGMQPIVGPRYKSNVKEDYDLCAACFHRMGNDAQYTRIDKPISPHRLSRDPNLCRKIHSRAVMKSKRDKLESRFILDVTVLDGTLMSPSTPFIKIWRMHNNGSVIWPLGTQLIWVGGDQFALQTSVPLEIPVNGFPVDQEIDVAVDFVAPARPGRYISYWRLASPSGQKFGQRVWVHIQVEDLSFVNDNRTAALNFNLPPGSNSMNTRNLIDVNIEPVNQAFSEHANSSKVELLVPSVNHEDSEPKKSSYVSAAAPPHPIADIPSSSASPTAFVPNVDMPAPKLVTSPVPTSTSFLASIPVNVPELVTSPVPTPTSFLASIPVNVPELVTSPVPTPTSSFTSIPVPTPTSSFTSIPVPTPTSLFTSIPVPTPTSLLTSNPANVLTHANTPVDAASSEPLDIDKLTEEKLLQELEEMGFRQVDLNKEILRQNKYNLEQSVDDLCGVNEWDPLLAELHEMGFDDTETNRELLSKNGGSIKRAVMDLITREKKDK